MPSTNASEPNGSVETISRPHPWRWGILCLIFIAAMLAAFLCRGIVAPRLANSGLRLQITPTQELVIGLGVLVLAGFLFRRSRYAWLARKPGPIAVDLFTAHNGDVTTADAVMSRFRQAMRRQHLSPTGPAPNAASNEDWLEVIGKAVDESKNPVAATFRSLGRLWVSHAYRVTGALNVRQEEPRCGLTVKVSVLPTGIAEEETFWGKTWDEVVEEAAPFVGAFILPRSRRCRLAPWPAWRGRRMPHRLFSDHLRGAALEKRRRNEEALDYYSRALKADPQNPYLGIERLQVLEQLGMHLDALEGYLDIIRVEAWEDARLRKRIWREVASPAAREANPCSSSQKATCDGEEKPPKVWSSPSRPWRSWRPWRGPRNGRDALLLARYRLVCQWAMGDRLADEWFEGTSGDGARASGSKREQEREVIRRRLRREIEPKYQTFRESYDCPEAFPSNLGDFKNIESVLSMPILRLFFQHLAAEESERLRKDYRWLSLRRRRGMPLSQTSLALMSVWAPLQLYAAERRLNKLLRQKGFDDIHVSDESRARKRLRRDLNEKHGHAGPWPPPVEQVRDRVSRILYVWWKSLFRKRQWYEEYNAACTLAVTLLDVEPRENDEQDGAREPEDPKVSAIAREAIRHLERAIVSTDSGYAATRTEWVEAGDPDLDEVRRSPRFVEFMTRFFPGRTPHVRRPRQIMKLLLSRHMVALALNYARLRELWWEKANPFDAARPHADVAWEEEQEARRLLRDYAVNRDRWQTRLALFRATERLAKLLDEPSPSSKMPDYRDDPTVKRSVKGGQKRSVDALAATAIHLRADFWRSFSKKLATLDRVSSERPSDLDSVECRDWWRARVRELAAAEKAGDGALKTLKDSEGWASRLGRWRRRARGSHEERAP